MQRIAAGLFVTAIMAQALVAQDCVAETPAGTVELSAAWTPATSQSRANTPLFMTIANRGDAPDSLLRARCPASIADFTEKHVTDRGEGGTAMREVKNFAIPAQGTVTLAPGGNHLMLLQVREPLTAGQTFTCSIVFQNAGTVAVEVRVAPADAKAAP
jgi:copper(I)-binding protein